MIVSPIWESVGFCLVIRIYCTKKDKLNTGEVGFEPTTGILEIRRGRIRTHDKDFGDPYYNQLNYTPLLKN